MYGDCNWRLIFTFMLKEISISPNYYPQTYTIINFACIKKKCRQFSEMYMVKTTKTNPGMERLILQIKYAL